MTTIKRVLAALATLTAGLFLVLGVAGPSSAAPPYTNNPTLGISNATPKCAGNPTVTGTGFTAGQNVTLTLDSTPPSTYGPVIVGKNGSFKITTALPDGTDGQHTITATDPKGEHASVTFTIKKCKSGVAGVSTNANTSSGAVADPGGHGTDSASDGGLASTGVAIGGLGLLGVGLLVAGVFFVRSGRRRHGLA